MSRFTGPITTIQQNTSLQGQGAIPYYITGEVDPTVVPTFAFKGTVYSRIGANGGAFYQKQDDGNTTNWILNAASGGTNGISVNSFANVIQLNFDPQFTVDGSVPQIATVSLPKSENTIPYYPDNSGTPGPFVGNTEAALQYRSIEKIIGIGTTGVFVDTTTLPGSPLGILGIGADNIVNAGSQNLIIIGADNTVEGLTRSIVMGNDNVVAGTQNIVLADDLSAPNPANGNNFILARSPITIPGQIDGSALLFGASVTISPTATFGAATLLADNAVLNGSIIISSVKALGSAFSQDTQISVVSALGGVFTGPIVLSDIACSNNGGGGLTVGAVTASIVKTGDASFTSITSSIALCFQGSGLIILESIIAGASNSGNVYQSVIAGGGHTNLSDVENSMLLGSANDFASNNVSSSVLAGNSNNWGGGAQNLYLGSGNTLNGSQQLIVGGNAVISNASNARNVILPGNGFVSSAVITNSFIAGLTGGFGANPVASSILHGSISGSLGSSLQSIVLVNSGNGLGPAEKSIILADTVVSTPVDRSIILGEGNLPGGSVSISRSIIIGENNDTGQSVTRSIVNAENFGATSSCLFFGSIVIVNGTVGSQPDVIDKSLVIADAYNVSQTNNSVLVGANTNSNAPGFQYNRSVVVGTNGFSANDEVQDSIIVGSSTVYARQRRMIIVGNGNFILGGANENSIIVGDIIDIGNNAISSLVLGDNLTINRAVRSIIISSTVSMGQVQDSLIIGIPVGAGNGSFQLNFGNNNDSSGRDNVHLFGANLTPSGNHQTLMGPMYPTGVTEADTTLGVGRDDGGTPTKVFSVHKSGKTAIAGAIRKAIRVDAANPVAILGDLDYTVITTGAAPTVDLPAGEDGMYLIIRHLGAGTAVLTCNGANLFDSGLGGLSTFNLINNQTIQIQFVTGVWYAVGYY